MANHADTIGENMVVTLSYVLTVDGEIVDTAEETAPIHYIQGHNQIIPALERELEGLAAGDSKHIFVPAGEGYGDYDPNMVADINRDQFPPEFIFSLGGQLQIQDTQGHTFNATIRGIGPENITLDLNHPLAGKDLLFQTTVVHVRPATPFEIENGQVDQ